MIPRGETGRSDVTQFLCSSLESNFNSNTDLVLLLLFSKNINSVAGSSTEWRATDFEQKRRLKNKERRKSRRGIEARDAVKRGLDCAVKEAVSKGSEWHRPRDYLTRHRERVPLLASMVIGASIFPAKGVRDWKTWCSGNKGGHWLLNDSAPFDECPEYTPKLGSCPQSNLPVSLFIVPDAHTG